MTPLAARPSVQRALTFDAMPAPSLPLRYFLSAPLFAALAAALLWWSGEAAWSTRWAPQTLALTHLFTLGCLTMCMVGALLQLLPVVSGAALPRVAALGAWVHALLCAGTLLLAAAFWTQRPALFALALAALLPALLLFVGACAVGLWHQHPAGAAAVVAAIRPALAALVVTVALGALLAGAYLSTSLAALPLMQLTDLHASWGLLGWVGVLIIGIAFQVVPMFQVTEPYPPWLTGSYATILFLLLVAASIAATLPQAGAARAYLLILAVLAGAYALFAVATLWLLAHRKRPVADTTTMYWRCAMASLLAAIVLWLAPAASGGNSQPLAIGVLLIAGVGWSTISGMLYKIVPFLVWFHAQANQAHARRRLPGVNKMIPAKRANAQFALHLLALVLLLAACYRPALVRPAAAAALLACAGLWCNLLAATRLLLPISPPASA
jgi:hypothetical protein